VIAFATLWLSLAAFMAIDEAFAYGNGRMFELVRWMRNFHQSTWDHEILYADRATKDKQVL
jgi:hypothetical protein